MFSFQVQELHRKLSEETRRADNLAFEMKKLEEKHETVMKEKEVRQRLKCVRRFFFIILNSSCGKHPSLTFGLFKISSPPLEDHYRERVSEGDQRGAAMHSGSTAPALPSRCVMLSYLIIMILLSLFAILK